MAARTAFTEVLRASTRAQAFCAQCCPCAASGLLSFLQLPYSADLQRLRQSRQISLQSVQANPFREPVLQGRQWRRDLQKLLDDFSKKDCFDFGASRPFEEIHFVKRIVRMAQLEIMKNRLQKLNADCLSRKEFLRMCEESVGEADAEETARLLDEFGQILIIGDSVFLPHLVQRAVQSVIPLLEEEKASDVMELQKKDLEELKAMEEQKCIIDANAKKIVRRELWCGLGVLGLSTGVLMRLTFWDLSWDVMEPICFFLTQFGFLAGLAFHMKTSALPTIEGIFKVRFDARQKRLMQLQDFDIKRFHYLKKIFLASG